MNLLISELENPYDKESLRLFPRTFKRFNNVQTIRCIKCGIDHPTFYYRYPKRNICNSCLAQPSDTHFTCKSCQQEFYYDFATLFKYERLVEKKDFVMPTHCPYCRADKRSCSTCSRIAPAYRIDDNGMCFDCASDFRNRIVEVYRCRDCPRTIELTQGQYDFHMKKFGKLPLRCEQCRQNRRSGY